MKLSKAIFIFAAILIGIGLLKMAFQTGQMMFFLMFVIILPFLNWFLPLMGRRFFPIKRYYPLRLSIALVIAVFILDYWFIIKKLPNGYEWLTVVILVVAYSAIDTFFPIKPKERNKK